MASISELLLEKGRSEADVRRRRGERAGALVTSLGQIPAAIVADRQAAKAAEVRARVEAQREARAQTATDIAASAENRALTKAEQDAQATADAKTQEQRGREAMQGWLKQHAGTIGPEATDRISAMIQTPDGLKAAIDFISKNAPGEMQLVDHDPERDLIDKRTGAVVRAGVPKPEVPRAEPNPTESSLALAAANGNKSAQKALDILNRQRAAGQAPNKNPLDTQTEWAIPPGETEAKLMTRAEVMRTGAKRPAGADKPSSGQQKRVLNFFNRARQADTDLEGLESEIQGQSAIGQGWQAVAPNFLQTQLGQSYTAAQRAFTEARLRKDSGAAIPEQEFKNDRQTYFMQFGDSKETLEQKRRARAAILASLAFESGQALGEDLGDADEAKATIQRFKDRAAGKSATGGKSLQKIGRFEVVEVK